MAMYSADRRVQTVLIHLSLLVSLNLQQRTLASMQVNTAPKLRAEVTAFWHAVLPKGLAARLCALLADGASRPPELVGKLGPDVTWPLNLLNSVAPVQVAILFAC